MNEEKVIISSIDPKDFKIADGFAISPAKVRKDALEDSFLKEILEMHKKVSELEKKLNHLYYPYKNDSTTVS